jgi:hypothetical protein
MALAWNAGWVNSPQGFKSPILRTRSGCGELDDSLVAAGPISTRRGWQLLEVKVRGSEPCWRGEICR